MLIFLLYSLGLLCALSLAGLCYWFVSGLAAFLRRQRLEQRQRPLRLRIHRRATLADRYLLLGLRARWPLLPRFLAGQYLTLILPTAQGELRRAYSLAAWSRWPGEYELAIKLEDEGAGTQWLWQHAQPGLQLQVRRPAGHFVLAPVAQSLILVAGGIGITPHRAFLHALQGQPCPPRVVLWHAGRSEADLLYREELAELAQQYAWFSYQPILSRPDAGWPGRRGRLDIDLLLAHSTPVPGLHLYCCAGEALTQALLDGWNAQGLVAEHFHTEAFGVAENPDQASYSVQLDQHALVFQGQPSLLALSPSAWPQADCRAGQCGGCLTRLEAGEVNWRLPAECAVPAGKILACCCVPLGPLRLSTG